MFYLNAPCEILHWSDENNWWTKVWSHNMQDRWYSPHGWQQFCFFMVKMAYQRLCNNSVNIHSMIHWQWLWIWSFLCMVGNIFFTKGEPINLGLPKSQRKLLEVKQDATKDGYVPCPWLTILGNILQWYKHAIVW